MTKLTIFQGDKLYDLNFTLQDNAGTVIDITGCTLLFKVQQSNNTALKFSGSMTIVNATQGKCKYTVADGNFDVAGIYKAEIEVTFGSGRVITFGDILIECKAQLPTQSV